MATSSIASAALGRDEFGELAEHFNHMVAELQATTVSKALLQESEAKLQETVDELRREITARARAEEERARLQASLASQRNHGGYGLAGRGRGA